MKSARFALSFCFLLSSTAMADVTPSYLALEKVEKFLLSQANREIHGLVQVHKHLVYPVANRVSLMRGKFSTAENGRAHYFGTVERTYDHDTPDVTCNISATVQVVPFAKQERPILEEETNNEQLIVQRSKVSCSFVE